MSANAKLQKIHEARTIRALSNLKELLSLRARYGFTRSYSSKCLQKAKSRS